MRLTNLVRNPSGRLTGVEMRGSWLITTSSQGEGAPFLDECRSATEVDGVEMEYFGVLAKLRPSAGRGLVVATRRRGPKWRWLPGWLTRPRSRGEFFPRRPLMKHWPASTEPTVGECSFAEADRDVPGVLRWVSFVGGSMDGDERPIRLPLEDGATYNVCVPIDQTWKYSADRDRFELLP